MAARIQRRLGRTCALLASFVIKGVARLKNRTLVNLVERGSRGPSCNPPRGGKTSGNRPSVGEGGRKREREKNVSNLSNKFNEPGGQERFLVRGLRARI